MKYYKYYPFHLIYLLTKKAKSIFYLVKDVNRFLRIILFVLIFSFSFNSFSQQPVVKKTILDTVVRVNIDNYSLKECLSILTKEYGVNFSYINDEIPLLKQIHYKSINQPLNVLLDTVCRQANIRYFLVGTQIVLKNVEPSLAAVAADSNAVVLADSAQSITSVDTTSQQSGKRESDTYQMNKKYKKYFFSVFGKQRVPDSMVVVSTNGSSDTLIETSKKYRYVNRIYAYPRFSIGAFVGTGIAYRRLTGDEYYVAERNSNEQSVLNYVLGLQGTYYIQSLHISFRSGLNYMTFGEKGTFNEIIFLPPQVPPGGGPGPPPSEILIEHSYQNRYSYFMLPVLIGYNFNSNNRLGVSIYSGMTFAFLVSIKSTYEEITTGNRSPVDMNRNPFIHSYNTVSIVLPVQMEVSYQITPKTQLFVAPSFNYFLTSIYSKNDGSKEKLYAFNFSIGINYFLKGQ